MEFENSEGEQSQFAVNRFYDSAKKSNESDLSGDESKLSKKDLLIGKRKDKDSKKDRGYAALEGESSPEEIESKSPLKSKKTKSFKFASKKKEKLKSEKKEKRNDLEEEPIFGVSLELAVERSRCHDGVQLPLMIREAIDYIEEHGMTFEGLYKVSSVKSKVQQVKQLYNNRLKVEWGDFDVTTATGLIKCFIRELPSTILTPELLPKFEEFGSSGSEVEVQGLVQQLPIQNRTFLSWLMIHLHNVVCHEKHTKMNVQSLAVTLSSVFGMSQRLMTLILNFAKFIFPDTQILKYYPPLTSSAVSQLSDVDTIASELKKQESLLSQIHHDMHAGFVTKEREEQLWEVQRIITQLKRKLRTVQKPNPQPEESVEEIEEPVPENPTPTPANIIRATISDDDKNILLLQFQNSELIELQTFLLTQLQIEKNEITLLKKQLKDTIPLPPVTATEDQFDKIIDLLMKENLILNIKKNNLIRELMEQREECVNLQSQLLFIALSQN